MKRLLLLLILLVTAFQGFSQTRGISYQAVILSPQAQEIPGSDAQGNILANSAVSIQFTIVNAAGSEEYQEQHNTRTDRYGMINLVIGAGEQTSSNNFVDILWNGTAKKLKVGIDFSAGSNFSSLGEQNLTYMPSPPTVEVSFEIAEIRTAITAESDRAGLAEKDNTDAITAEVIRAGLAENANTDAIIAEVKRAGLAENANTDAIIAEVKRAGLAEKSNSDAITAGLNLKANLNSPSLTGVPLSSTATANTNTNQIATTAFVTTAAKAYSDALEVKSMGLATRISALEPLRPEIGDLRDGGVVFWVDETGQRGLVCAIEDQTTAIQWYNGVGSSDISTAATDRRIGSGAENTTKIINAYGATTTDYAAGLGRDYKGGVYIDWFLPSRDELQEIYINREAINAAAVANGGTALVNELYWSSTEANNNLVYVGFKDGGTYSSFKNSTYRVRSIRAFKAVTEATEEAINAEASRAGKAEDANKAAIEEEVKRAGIAEGANKAAIEKEATTARAAEDANKAAIEKEAIDARAAEKNNADAITAEATIARAAEKANADAITAEATTARAAEDANKAAIEIEATTARAAEKNNADAITAEAITARAAEDANKAAIEKEATIARAAEGDNKKAIEAEAATARAAEKANADAIEKEAIDARAAEKNNLDAITAEATTARAAEGDNKKAIEAEAATARAAEKANADAISLKANINNPTFTGTVVTTAIKVTGGTIAAGKVLTSDADGLASWQAVSAVVREIGDEFIAVGPTSSFRLSSIPSQNNIVKMYINGVRISNKANSNADGNGLTQSYNSVENGGYLISIGDRIQFDYYTEQLEDNRR